MRRIRLDVDVKVPIMKNIIYAFKLIWKADNRLMLGYIVQLAAERFFSLFVQNILFLKVLLSIIDGEDDFRVYVKYLIMFFGISLLLKVLKWGGNYVTSSSTKKVLQRLNNMIFEKAISLDVGCYEDPAFYDNYQRATNVLAYSYFDAFCNALALVLGDIIAFICVITTVTAINPVYLLFLVPVLFVFAIELKKSKTIYKRDWAMTTNNRIKSYVQRTVFLREYSKDMRTSNIFAVLMKRFEGAIEANIVILKEYGLKLFIYSVISSTLSEFIPIIGTYAYAGYQFIYQKNLTVSGFSVVLSSINSVRSSTLEIAECFNELSAMALYFQNLRDFFEYEPKITDGDKTPEPFESLEFRNVTFRYPTAKKNSLENISFKINKGETVAIVGVNGAGKSTLVKLLLRFYDPDEGEIFYNGINIKEYKVNELRNCFASVFQDYKNFAISVFENVICRECTEEEKELAEKALRQSDVWNKIETLPHGGETVLTKEFDKNGAGLSGGENQKVSTARLFASDFQIAILDEPSSALDPIAEYKMYENLISATEDKTVLYISHRLSSAVLSDRIIVLDSGRISEMGSHTELLNSGGQYSKMFALQASSYLRKEAD